MVDGEAGSRRQRMELPDRRYDTSRSYFFLQARSRTACPFAVHGLKLGLIMFQGVHWTEFGRIVAEGDLVIVHGRFSGFGATVNWIAADIVRIQNGILVEHWDVIQDEATEEQSKSKAPMFGKSFPKYSVGE